MEGSTVSTRSIVRSAFLRRALGRPHRMSRTAGPKTAQDSHRSSLDGKLRYDDARCRGEWQNGDAKNWEKGVSSPHPLFFFLLAAPINGHPTCQLSQLPCRRLTVFMQVSRAPAFFISRQFATRRFRAIGTVLGGHAVTNGLQTDRRV